MGHGSAAILGGMALLVSSLAGCTQPAPVALGPLCPEVTQTAFTAQPIRTKYDFDYDALTLSRAFGHMECNEVKDTGLRLFLTYPSCQLTGPGVLKVKANGADHLYLPGVGRPVTVSLHRGKLTCVLDRIG